MLRLICSADTAVRNDIIGGATLSIFPKVDTLLISKTDYQSALSFVDTNENLNSYLSMVDFIFCSINPRWQNACKRFYKDEGCPLRKLITEDERVIYEYELLIALKTAHSLYKRNLQITWDSYYGIFETELLKAA